MISAQYSLRAKAGKALFQCTFPSLYLCNQLKQCLNSPLTPAASAPLPGPSCSASWSPCQLCGVDDSQPGAKWISPCWHMPIASMWFFPYCDDSFPHEALCPEYQEFGPLTVFQTRLKTQCSSDSWQCQKCSVKIHLAFSSFAEDLNSCFLIFLLCHLSQSTIH